jgi:hypothetical protein
MENTSYITRENVNGAWVTVNKIDTEMMTPFIMQLGFEVYADHTCGVPRSIGDCNCYMVDLEAVNARYRNRWLVPLAFAHRFADEGMRVFPEETGVMIVSVLDEHEFMKRFEEIVPEINASILELGKGVECSA